MIPITKIGSLTSEEFFRAYANGELNSLDLPAREYFDRQDLIKEKMEEHLARRESKGQEFIIEKHVLHNATDDVMAPAYGILYAKEGEEFRVMFCQSDLERERMVEDYGRTGVIDIMNYGTKSLQEYNPDAVVEINIGKVWKRQYRPKKV